MGLDMYAYAQDNPTISGVDEQPEDSSREEIAYWRKFNALHGWMENLYKHRGGISTFNCVDLPLHREDIKELKRAAITKTLLPTAGFFFGSQEPLTDDDWDEVHRFTDLASELLDAGKYIIYSSWW